MAGFTVMDMLNQQNRAGFDDSPKARFRTKDISISKMYRNKMNFYKLEDIESLAKDIQAHGLKQNLEVVHEPCENGEYRIISGERRWEALKVLVSEGLTKFEIATCRIVSPRDPDEEQIEIISANSYRTKDIADILEEEKRLKLSLERIRENGGQIEGYDLRSGKTRDIVASKMGMSSTKIAQIEGINNNLIKEFKDELTKGRITFSAAYELSGMEEPAQQLILKSYKSTGSLTHREVKAIKKGEVEVKAEPAGSGSEPVPASEIITEKVSESDTRKYVSYEEASVAYGMENPEEARPKSERWRQSQSPEQRPGDDYEPPHPESITSLCYSCKRYSDCNVKTGTCRKCDQYINKAEAEKTEEQRYSEEQDRIDRETRKKLRERAEEEKMKNLPSDTQKDKKGFHQIKTASQYFMPVCLGQKPFELRKNDRGYKTGDMLEMLEYKDGKCTGRAVRAKITFILEDYTGLKDGYCILGINVATQWYYAKEEREQQDDGEQRI
ncbi:DUF3850 domain-containing protein [Lachnospiraceae bacterium 62-26]